MPWDDWRHNMSGDVVTYWLIAQALGIAGLPMARVLLGALPDRGYAFAKPLGLLLTGYLAWLAAMLGLAPFGPPLIAVAALVVFGGGLLALRRDRIAMPATGIVAAPAPDVRLPAMRGAIAGWLRTNWTTILAYEAIFGVALVFLALLRAREYGFVGPNPWGTERPMDFAFFNAIRVSAVFPPHDPWMSGYSINYYYFGYLLMAAVSLLAGIHPATGYNLSLALIFALTALGIAGMVHNLIVLAQASAWRLPLRERQAADPAPPADPDPLITSSLPAAASERRAGARRGWSTAGRWLAVLLTVVAVLLAGNQAGALQLIVGDERVVALDGPQLVSAVAQALGGTDTIILPYPAYTGDFGEIATLNRTDRVADFNWWWPSRVVWDARPVWNQELQRFDSVRGYTITEFPFFSFWLGDMHPHVMALPFGVLALALALHTLARPVPPRFHRDRIELLLCGVVLGSLYMMNSWDLPTYVLFFLAALALKMAAARPAGVQQDGGGTHDAPGDEQGVSAVGQQPVLRRRSEQEAGSALSQPAAAYWRALLLNTALLIAACIVLIAPFLLTFTSLVGGRAPLIDLPLIGALTRMVGFVGGDKTGLHSFLIIFGMFLTPLIGLAALSSRDTARWLMLSAGIVGVASIFIGFPLAALLPLGLAAVLLARRHIDRPADSFVLGALALGCAICFGTELIYIRDVFESRMNTIFKFYYQTWLIWGVAGGYAAWRVTGMAGMLPGAGRRGFAGRGALLLVPGITLALLAGGLIYPWLTAGKAFTEGTYAGLKGRTPRERTPAGAEAIAWLRANLPGDAVILEAVGPSYDTGGLGYGGVASSTGLATVMGWEGHQQQWRGGDPALLAQIAPRAADVATIYSTTDVALARSLLAAYGVDYIYLGDAERRTYPPEGLAKLPELGAVVFQNSEVTIVKVQ